MRVGYRIVTSVAIGIAASCSGPSAPDGPSAGEQIVWQLVNRARADPAAEAERLLSSGAPDVEAALEAFAVDRDQVRADFATYEPRPPLAWSEPLAAAARRHALDLAATRSQGHRGSDGSLPARRVVDAGVDAGYVVENVTSAATTPFQAHASLLVDWGGGPPTGVQDWPSPGHRLALLAPQSDRPSVTAMGAAWIELPRSDEDPFGPFVLVQALADVAGTFVVGTVWRDEDGDGGLDPGEGVDGATVVVGTDGPAVATWSEGAYQLPVDGIVGAVTIRVEHDGDAVTADVVLDGANALVDLRLPPS